MASSVATTAAPAERKPLYKLLYVQVLTAILLGVVVGYLVPSIAALVGLSLWQAARVRRALAEVEARQGEK